MLIARTPPYGETNGIWLQVPSGCGQDKLGRPSRIVVSTPCTGRVPDRAPGREILPSVSLPGTCRSMAGDLARENGQGVEVRLLILPLRMVANDVITSVALLSGKVAPPAYYILFVNLRGIPGKGIWVHVD
ncbi:hypothetical protein R6Q59_006681 [Mikania micrantha]